MSEQLAACLIAVGANLVAMLVLYAVMALLLARLGWRGRGVVGILVTIVIAQLFWIAPALLIAGAQNANNAACYALWFGNWLVCGFAVVLLGRTASQIPRQLEDSARLDGLSSFATWRHVIFPFVRRDLGVLALFTLMATLLPFWAFLNLPEADRSIVLFQQSFSLERRIVMMAAGSLLGALPLAAMLLFVRGRPVSSAMSFEKTTESPPPLARG